MRGRNAQAAFTLIEIMVVVFIIAVMSGLSVLAINQASDRPYQARADELRDWLQQVADIAMLEGSAYGVLVDEDSLEALVYYQYRWHRLMEPEAFVLELPGRLSVNDARGERRNGAAARGPDDDSLLPDIVMLPEGYVETGSSLRLSYENIDAVYSYGWDDEQAGLSMSRQDAL